MQALVQGGLRSSASSPQAIGQAERAIVKPLCALAGLRLRRQVALAGEERKLLPVIDKYLYALAFDALCQGVITLPALLALDGIAQTRRGAFEDQRAEEARKAGIERD